MVEKKFKKKYLIVRNSVKPIIIKFRRKDGSVISFRAIKMVKKPQKVVFRKVKKVYVRSAESKFSKEGAKDE